MRKINDSDFDEMFDKMNKNFTSTAKRARAGALAIGLTVLLVALALTVAGVVLALTVSGWFWIAVIITGGYSLVSGIALAVGASAFKAIQ